MGDLIWHLPHIRAIAAASPDRKITLITKPSTQADILLDGDPAIERIVWFDRNPRQGHGRHDGPLGYVRLLADLRACRLQSCVLLHHGASLAAAMRLAGVRRRYGYGYSAAQRRWLNQPPFLGQEIPFTEAFDQATAYARAAGFGDLPEPELAVSAAARVALPEILAGMDGPIAVLGIGAHGGIRQWGTRPFAELAQALLARGYGTVLLLAAAHEAGLAAAIADAAGRPDEVRGAIGWKLAEVMAVLAEAALFVGNDSGLMNLRAALGQPAYGLFGASGPLRHSRHIRPVVPPGGARAGMDRISVQQVLDALDAPLF
jgi:heptosyltransferase-2